MPLIRIKICLAALLAISACSAHVINQTEQTAAHSVDQQTASSILLAVGEVSANSAVLWARTDTPQELVISSHDGKNHYRVTTQSNSDNTAKLLLQKLTSDTNYTFTICTNKSFANGAACPTRIQFRTAPAATDSKTLRIAWGGDVGGQNVCRDQRLGMPAFSALLAVQPDLFIGLGDMIYADNTCTRTGRYQNAQITGQFDAADSLPEFWAHWRYNRRDAAVQQLMASTPYLPIWDDHEVVNDFGPLSDTVNDQAPPLMPLGRTAFLDYNPIIGKPGQPNRLHHSYRWGKHLEFFALDTRQYRDANAAKDTPDRPKTLLGKKQKQWLQEQLLESTATWKIILSSVPIAIPTGYPPENGRDGWANYDQNTGYEQELHTILNFAAKHRINNLIWLSTDVHFATGFRYQPFARYPEFVFHEFISGPMNAGLFYTDALDPTFRPQQLFVHTPDPEQPVTDFTEAIKWMNFGVIDSDENGNLQISIINGAGASVYQTRLSPQQAQTRKP